MYLGKHRVCCNTYPESCILHLTKGKLWFAWVLLKHSWSNRFGKWNAACHDNITSAEGKRLTDNSSRPRKMALPFSHHGNITVFRVLKSFRNTKQQACRTSRRQSCIVSISFSTVFFSRGVYEETVARFFSCTFTFKVLSWKQITKKKNKRKIISPA